jgi:hypothetical protein
MKKSGVLYKIWDLYYSGFKNMTVGKTLWIIIIIKLCIMFLILKIFFFKNALNDYKTQDEKSNKVIENLTKPKL